MTRQPQARLASATSEVPRIRQAKVGLHEDADRPQPWQALGTVEGVAGHLPLEGVAAHAVAARGRPPPSKASKPNSEPS